MVALGVVGVGQRADRLLRQPAPAELAEQADAPARDVAREQRLDPVRPTATGARGRASPTRPAPRQSASSTAQPAAGTGSPRLGRVAAQVGRPRTRRGPWRPRSTGARAARPRARAGRGRAARPRAARARAGARRTAASRRSRRSAPRSSTGPRPARARRRATTSSASGQRDLDAVARSRAASRVHARVAQRAPPRACSAASSRRRASASTRRPRRPGCSSSSNSSSVSSFAISSRFARSQVTRRCDSAARATAAHAEGLEHVALAHRVDLAPGQRVGDHRVAVRAEAEVGRADAVRVQLGVLHEQGRGRAVGEPQPVVELDHRAARRRRSASRSRRAPAAAPARSPWRGSRRRRRA